ncbi:MAG: ShlB/FhaC/HecB family hemolysin secretion/activation protein [Pseudomonadota bacterium]|nr:ShlB/FhaC/HecB family hemolysin secretion/activation protein [Pseudomonadota bacterium]
MQRSDVIDRVNADLQPGVEPGDARLEVAVEEANPWLLSFVISNNRSPSVGAIHGEIFAGHRNVTGNADSLTARIGLTEGSNDGGLYYTLPIGAAGTELFAGADQSNSSVLQQPFASLDVDSELDTYRFGLRHPVLRTINDTATIGLALDLRSSLTKLLGRPFSFSEGVRDGRADVTVVRYSQSWLHQGLSQVIALRSTLSLGINAFGATINEQGPDGEFFAWLGQFQWARRTGNGHQFNLRSDLQLAANPLLPLEQCAIGGADTVRGYRVNQLVRDNCFVASLEYRVPLFRLPLPKISQGPEDGTIRLAPFFDFGAAWNTDRQDFGPDTLPSLGVGLRWDPSPKVHANVYWGYAFQDFVVQGEDLQDDGIVFRVEVDVF